MRQRIITTPLPRTILLHFIFLLNFTVHYINWKLRKNFSNQFSNQEWRSHSNRFLSGVRIMMNENFQLYHLNLLAFAYEYNLCLRRKYLVLKFFCPVRWTDQDHFSIVIHNSKKEVKSFGVFETNNNQFKYINIFDGHSRQIKNNDRKCSIR